MTEALGEPIADCLVNLADHIRDYHFDDGPRKAIVLGARNIIHAVGEHDDCPHCFDGFVPEDETADTVRECDVCYGTNRDLPGDVHAVVDREREMVEFWRGKYAELVEQRECEGQQHLGEVAG